MAAARLPTALWVMAQVRRCNDAGVPAMVLRKGDPDGGMVILRTSLLDGTGRVYTLTRDMEGELAWLGALGGAATADAEIDAYVARQTQRDPDLWVVEIEDREGRMWFEGKVL